MKLLVFAHIPPPHHGQSYMVKLMLDGFGGDVRHPSSSRPLVEGIQCYHVNARFSRDLADVGEFQAAKLFLIFWFCLQAIWIRFRHGVTSLYYVPAPGKKNALYRDWLIMLICRPFFKKLIFHWHAAGLAKWLEFYCNIHLRSITYRLFKPVDLSIVLSKHTVADAEKFLSSRIQILPCGIPDPCPDFDETIMPRRRARLAARASLMSNQSLPTSLTVKDEEGPSTLKILYLAHCMREKGLFDAVDGVIRAGELLGDTGSPLRLHLSVAGEFVTSEERAEFDQKIAGVGSNPASRVRITYLGFVSGERKRQVFIENDFFCFPTYYHAESFGLVVVEAMAFGLPVITTSWRSLADILPSAYPGLVDIQSPTQVADALLRLADQDISGILRSNFIARFKLDTYLKNLAGILHGVDTA